MSSGLFNMLSTNNLFTNHIYIYIYIYTLKWIGPKEDLLLSHLFFFSMCFWHFVFWKWNNLVIFPLIYIVATVLIRLWFFLIPGFVSANFQFKLIVCDKFSSLLMLFLSFSFFLGCAVGACVSVCVYINFCFPFIALLNNLLYMP